jgi:hypothetical protein
MGLIQVLGMLIERMDILDLTGMLLSISLFRLFYTSEEGRKDE